MAHEDSSHVHEALDYLRLRLPAELQKPAVGVICGSGLGGLADALLEQPQVAAPYVNIPHFATSTVPGHAGKLVFGLLEADRRPVVLMVGRLHFYEGHSMTTTTFPVRLMKRLGVETLISGSNAQCKMPSVWTDFWATNAAGSLHPTYFVGDIVILNDHVYLAGFSGVHPLRGPNADDFGVRFPAMSDAYDLELRRSAHRTWKQMKEIRNTSRELHEGVYAFVGGPNYETRAECRLLRTLGADVVGMSTVPEVIVARHAGMRVLALSLVTNNAVLEPGPRGDEAGIQDVGRKELTKVMEARKANHEEVLDAARSAQEDVQKLVSELIRGMLREGG